MAKFGAYPITYKSPPRGLRYRLFRLWWMWKHRNWKDTRQKRKALEKEWLKKCRKFR